ncbi:PHD finger protein 20-like [Diretmus argenteus]
MKSPPDRSGITFEVGAQLEARDCHRTWYTASIEKIDYEKEQVLIHYRRWSRRHDEWFPWNSPYLRPLKRISLRKQGLRQPRPPKLFGRGTKVLACWTDCRFYPAKVLKVNKGDSYTVRFYDGVVRTVKPTKVKPFKEAVFICSGGEPGSALWTLECSSNGTQNQPIRTDFAQPDATNSAHTDRDVLLERQVHLPTTHKYSREPLYRVIKNQPPPILSIELDHNPFKCPAPDCTKSFRKGSLLHYHIKYYHSDQQLEGQGSDQETQWRKQSSPEGRDFLSERRKENQNNTFHHDNRDHSAMATVEVKKEGGREKDGEQERKETRNRLRVKLKKKRKKNRLTSAPPPPADDGSDWSTLTAESEEDTYTWPVAMDTEEGEVVRCVCEVDEENDFMIQCELCLCWQHGTCMGLYEDNVPHSYTCYCCRDAAGWRRCRGFLPDPDWLTSGHMFGLSCVTENYSELNGSKMSHTNHLLVHAHDLNQVLKGLQLKMSLLHSPSHPELQLWRLPWRQEEEPAVTANQREQAPERTCGFSPGCYVSSEHCYQKPEASWEKTGGGREKEMQMTTRLDQNQNQNSEEQLPADERHRVLIVIYGLGEDRTNPGAGRIGEESEGPFEVRCHQDRLLAEGLPEGLERRFSLAAPLNMVVRLGAAQAALLGICREARSSQGPQDGFKMFQVLPPGGAVDYDVVQVGCGIRAVGSEDPVHQALERGWSAMDPKRQHPVDHMFDNAAEGTGLALPSLFGEEEKPEDVNKKQTDTRTHRDTPSQPPPVSVLECQLNLLQHIESLHNQITARMDLVERELGVLESWLDHSGELEPPEPLSRLPQLKQRIRRLLCDLGTVRCLSVCH